MNETTPTFEMPPVDSAFRWKELPDPIVGALTESMHGYMFQAHTASGWVDALTRMITWNEAIFLLNVGESVRVVQRSVIDRLVTALQVGEHSGGPPEDNLAARLRELADPRKGLARGFPDAQATLNDAADEIDRQESAIAVLEQENEAMRHEIERLRRRDLQWAADVVWRSEWMTRAVNLLGEIREALEYELGESGHLAELEDLLHDEFEDGDSDDD